MRKNKRKTRKETIYLLIFLIILGSGWFWFAKFQAAKPIKVNTDRNPSLICKNHAYQGSAELLGWYVKDGERNYIEINRDEKVKLPKNETTDEMDSDTTKIMLVDATPETAKSLEGSNKDNPKTIKVTGFATSCDGRQLASLEYKEGIFRSFLK